MSASLKLFCSSSCFSWKNRGLLASGKWPRHNREISDHLLSLIQKRIAQSFPAISNMRINHRSPCILVQSYPNRSIFNTPGVSSTFWRHSWGFCSLLAMAALTATDSAQERSELLCTRTSKTMAQTRVKIKHRWNRSVKWLVIKAGGWLSWLSSKFANRVNT